MSVASAQHLSSPGLLRDKSQAVDPAAGFAFAGCWLVCGGASCVDIVRRPLVAGPAPLLAA